MYTVVGVSGAVVLVGLGAVLIVVLRAASARVKPRRVALGLCVAAVLAGSGGVVTHASEIVNARQCIHCYAGLRDIP